MKYLTRMLAYTRLLQLKRQWKLILGLLPQLSRDEQQILGALVYGEAMRAAKHPMPQFYASQKTEAYCPWGDAVDKAFERVRNADRKTQLRGVAMWLAVVFHETAFTSVAPLQQLHGAVAAELERYRILHERVLAIRMAA